MRDAQIPIGCRERVKQDKRERIMAAARELLAGGRRHREDPSAAVHALVGSTYDLLTAARDLGAKFAAMTTSNSGSTTSRPETPPIIGAWTVRKRRCHA
jgi:hypothetical protein